MTQQQELNLAQEQPELTGWLSVADNPPTHVGWYICSRYRSTKTRSWWDGQEMRGCIFIDNPKLTVPVTGGCFTARDPGLPPLEYIGLTQPHPDGYPYDLQTGAPLTGDGNE